MKIIHTVSDLNAALAPARDKGFSIGFVPTMGALHKGHLSLVERCVENNDICVASIFVNPTQFNDKKDLAAYPRTPEKDCALLATAGCHIVFAPSEEEMYPVPDERVFALGDVADVMEGRHRPGHFNGVAQIVSKLFAIVNPQRAYFGEKDFQQIAVIKAMAAQLNLNVEIIACPIIREDDGLAMSSRNTRLTPQERLAAPRIAQALRESAHLYPSKPIREAKDYVLEILAGEPMINVEYFEIVNGLTLQPLNEWADNNFAVGCIAAWCGNVRLIDNIIYNK
ncbi:MAG: pantoate--beta-alanine ligase [Tannerellaceae bacterium]|jgi:pantoate--beta-alanine ligase|nr:pantoate--beta-alanine ligase [Tannerellaceae bacterium]